MRLPSPQVKRGDNISTIPDYESKTNRLSKDEINVPNILSLSKLTRTASRAEG